MAHGHAGHAHAHVRQAGERRLALALGLILALLCAEVAVGVIARSLALLSDAGHMLTDAAALALSLLALRLARRPARGALTFGLRRVEVISAQANGVTLLVLAAFVVYEAIARLANPPHVEAWAVLAVALAGAAVNVLAVSVVSGADRSNLGVEGSFQHLLTDLYGFLGTAIAAVVILATGFARADAIVSLLIATLMARSGLGLVMASGRIFLEAAPEGLDPDEIGSALAAQRGVVEVHDLHVWEVTPALAALSAHVLVRADCDCHLARRAMEQLLRERFGLHHTTLQVDHDAGGELLEIQPRAESPAQS
ncbi:MAG TPA: cation diffusion facilitator family transporter [Solirubrobacteraceae bacterium]|nr:cation diffusion facilitator family transporter [Solirubrobacteraceae bacterium]